MKELFVLYDRTCELCIRCRHWLEQQPKFLDLVFLPTGTPEVKRCFPGLSNPEQVEELVVIDDAGGVYRGTRAWIMCLYALREYREWSATLSGPALMPLAKRAFDFFSRNRFWISRWLSPSDEQVIEEIRAGADELAWGEGAVPMLGVSAVDRLVDSKRRRTNR